MVFSSLLFLYAFLPVFMTLYYWAPLKSRNGVALLGSLVFYAWGEPRFAGLLVLSGLFGYTISRLFTRAAPSAWVARRSLLALGVTGHLGVLAYFKYSNFFVAQLNGALGWLAQGSVLWTTVALPLGISFFTFQKISYLVDVYRGTTPPARSLFDYLLYIALFPQLIAGPIIRYRDVAAQIAYRDHTTDRFLSGAWRFCLGLGRKVLVANPLGAVADRIFAQDLTTLPMPYAWAGLLCYAFQIYFDFAGYSDMAIGLGRMMGFEFAENFDRPYTARSVTEFWRRWHRSLSSFMRDYLYIPLGGSRASRGRTLANLWLVFLASGFWHGASWSFVFWGAYHGTLLTVERVIGVARIERLPAALGTLVTFALVTLGWVFFRAETLPDAIVYLGRLTAWSSAPEIWTNPALLWPDVLSRRTLAVLTVAAAVSFVTDRWWRRHGWDDPLPATRRQAGLRLTVAVLCLFLASAALAGSSYNPFIYFRF
jgi:alginate O-acetyltransferase complex protein AlgI